MRTRVFVATALVAAFGLGGAAAPVPKHLIKDDPDLTAMQGAWKLTDVTLDGDSLGAELAAGLELTVEIRDNTMVTTGLRYKQRITTTIALDAKVHPRRMTSTNSRETDLDGKPANKPDAKETAVASYKIDGDTLVIAGTTGDVLTAPKDFKGKGIVSMTFTRVKK